MKTTLIGKTPFSQMSLGTVQLGMNYGIANNAGQPSLEQSFAVLQTAIDGGVTALDTAAGYGESERVIGRFLKTRGGKKDLFITTKFLVRQPIGTAKEAVKDEIRRSVDNSLANLGVDAVDCLMLHRASDFANFGDAVAEALREFKDEGRIGRVGVSIYLPGELEAPMRYDMVEMVQAPMNMFDHALHESPYMQTLRDRNIALIVRSVFLQGLFFLDPDGMTDEDLVAAAAPKLRVVHEIARQEQMSVAEMAVSYIRDMPGVTSLVLGAENPSQVAQNLALFAPNAPVLSEAGRARIDSECAADLVRIMKVLSRPKG